jgi:glycerol uptake facilitator-like aquaporin
VGIAATVAIMAVVTAGGRLGIGACDPAWMLALLIRRRVGLGDLLPVWAAQAVGAVAFGALARQVVDELPPWSVVEQPKVAPAVVVLAIVAVAGAWVVLTVDAGRAAPIAAGLPALGAAAVVAPTFAAAANPAALFALGVAGVAEWTYVFFATLAALGGAVLGAVTVPLLAHPNQADPAAPVA